MTTDSLQTPTSTKAPGTFTLANRLLIALLRSPLHGLASHTLVVLSYQGRKSGKTYTFPTGYTQQGSWLMPGFGDKPYDKYERLQK